MPEVKLTDIERLAITTLSTKDLKEARDGVVPGKYGVDVTIRIHGEISVAPDTEVSPSASLPTQLLLVQILKRMGHSRESGMALLTELTGIANKMTPAEKKQFTSESGYDEAEAAYKANVTAKLGKSPRRGAVKGDLAYEALAFKTLVISQVAPTPRNAVEQSDAEQAVDAMFDL